MRRFTSAILLSTAVCGMPFQAKRADDYQVTDFAAYVAAHSIAQIISFDAQLPSKNVSCGNAGSALLSSSPSFLAVTGGKCDDSLVTFNFTQIANQAITLAVIQEDGPTATYTSDAGMVAYVTTGSTPLDTETAYIGPQDFILTVSE